MELHNKVQETKSTVESNDFTIASTSKAFKILSNNLYSDKITAVIRELSTNALDAHISVGKKDLPFDIEFSDKFSVRDYGPGMSEEFIMSLYSSYFSSDKNNSNDFIGALGLGSKSPFAYTDSFVITSWNNKMKKSYSCFIGENGVPQISKLLEKECGSETGFKVELNFLKEDDKFIFIEKAKSVYKYFDVQPNSDFEIPKKIVPDVVFEGNNWKLYNKDYKNNCIAIMGNIGYPINLSKIPDFKFNDILDNNFEINFDIGELDITPSREMISYDKKTIYMITNKCKVVIKEVINNIQKDINKEQNFYDAKKIFNDFNNKINNFDSIKIEFIYKNKVVNSLNFKISNIFNSNISTYIREYSSLRKERFVYLNSSNKYTFVYNDLDSERKGIMKGRYFLLNNTSNKRNCVLIFHPKELSEEKIKEFWDSIGNPNYIMASSIPTPPRRRNTTTVKDILEYKYIKEKYNTGFANTNSYSNFDKSYENSVYIIRIRNSYFTEINDKLKIIDIKKSIISYFNDLLGLSIFDENTTIFVVRKKHLNKIKKTNIVSYHEFIKNRFEEIYTVKLNELKTFIKNKIIINKIHEAGILKIEYLDIIYKSISKDSYYSKLIKKYYKYNKKNTIENKESILNLYSFIYSHDIKNDIKVRDIKSIYDVYPMLKHVSNYYPSSKDVEDIINYINLVGK
jgi:hypothetical protein